VKHDGDAEPGILDHPCLQHVAALGADTWAVCISDRHELIEKGVGTQPVGGHLLRHGLVDLAFVEFRWHRKTAKGGQGPSALQLRHLLFDRHSAH
jgi:hypothetical protein